MSAPTKCVRINGELHVKGECCQLYTCRTCGAPVHSSVSHDPDCTEVCEQCGESQFWEPVNGAKR